MADLDANGETLTDGVDATLEVEGLRDTGVLVRKASNRFDGRYKSRGSPNMSVDGVGAEPLYAGLGLGGMGVKGVETMAGSKS